MSKNNPVKLKGKLKKFYTVLIILAVVCVILNLFVAFINMQAALLMAIFTIAYVCAVLVASIYNRAIIMNELISFATQYGQVQRRLLRDLELPYALLDENSRVVWTNTAFKSAFHIDKEFRKSITSLFSTINKDTLPSENTEEELKQSIEYEECFYTVHMRKISMSEMAENSDIVEAHNYEGYLVACFFYDETALKIALREIDDQSVVVSLIYLDNYDEALESVEEVRRSLLIALIDRKINKYISALDGICKKIEKDKFWWF